MSKIILHNMQYMPLLVICWQLTGSQRQWEQCSCLQLHWIWTRGLLHDLGNAVTVMLVTLSLMPSNAASTAAGTLVTLRALQTFKLMAATSSTLVAKPPSLTSCLSRPDKRESLLPACLQQIL